MQRGRYSSIILIGFSLVIFSLMVTPLVSATPNPQDDEQFIEHTIRQGENLYRIAQQYNVTVADIVRANNLADPNDIFVGQVLKIPVRAGTQPQTPLPPLAVTSTPSPTPTLAPNAYRVQAGDSLYRIARTYNTTVRELMRLNNIADPNIVVIGQVLILPEGATAATTPSATPTVITPAATTPAPPTATPEATTAMPATPIVSETPNVIETPTTEPAPSETPLAETPTPAPTDVTIPISTAPVVDFAYGVQVYTIDQNISALVERVNNLSMDWVKIEAEWRFIEPVQGQYNLGSIEAALQAFGNSPVNVMLQVYGAPEWARPTSVEVGPPGDYQAYADFLTFLLERFPNQIQAIEVWRQPNLRSFWEGKALGGANYVELLRTAYIAIKDVDPSIVVVSAGLAPTGLNDGVNAINDREFLRQMYTAGIIQVVDAIGVMPAGYGNSPEALCCNTSPNPQWDNDPSFFFLNTLRDYHQIMMDNGDTQRRLWVTEFGWGSLDNTGIRDQSQIRAPQVGGQSIFAFVALNSFDEQALYTLNALRLGEREGYVGPMFIYNLNYCVLPTGEPACLWSMLDPAGNPRPVYSVVRDRASYP